MEHSFFLTVRKVNLHYFFPLFREGVIIKTLVGGNIKDFLSLDLNIPPDYVDKRIQTIFLDGKAVDDLEGTMVRDGSTLALSGALPGLVGATFRRKGTYASLRRAITFSEEKETIPQKEGRVVLKLFNLLVPELGPLFLAQGIWISGKDLDQFLKGRDEEFWRGLKTARMDHQDMDVMTLKEMRWSPNEEPVLLKVTPITPES